MGIAESIELRTMTTETVKQKLKMILENPKYAKNMEIVSARFKDQKENPLDRAIFWIEWLLRNPNAVEFLQSPVLRLGYIVGNFYDVVFIISIILLLLLYSIAKILLLYLRVLTDKSNLSSKKSKKSE